MTSDSLCYRKMCFLQLWASQKSYVYSLLGFTLHLNVMSKVEKEITFCRWAGFAFLLFELYEILQILAKSKLDYINILLATSLHQGFF